MTCKNNIDHLTEKESFWVSIIRMNKAFKIQGINKKWRIGRLEIEFDWRSSKNLWGRFGGGWNWKLGVQIGRTTVIMSLLIFSLNFRWKP